MPNRKTAKIEIRNLKCFGIVAREIAEQYPEYEFPKHKGYGTKLHYEKIMEHGISPVHRRSFLKKITGEK